MKDRFARVLNVVRLVAEHDAYGLLRVVTR